MWRLLPCFPPQNWAVSSWNAWGYRQCWAIGHLGLGWVALTHAARLLARARPAARTAEVLGRALVHPLGDCPDRFTRGLAEYVLPRLRVVLTDEELDAAMARGRAADVWQMADQVFGVPPEQPRGGAQTAVNQHED